MRAAKRCAAWMVSVTLLFAASVLAQARKVETRPKLVVVLVVDQMRADYVDKFRHQWNGGLRRLVDQGAWFRQAAYPYANTHTCVGHATVSTGALPVTHGIVDNSWWDRELGKTVTCTEDPQVQALSYGAAVKGGESPFRLPVPTISDELRAQSGGASRVVTMSVKARAAIMLAGHRADAVTWHDDRSGAWLTSSSYKVADWVEKFVKAHPVDADFGKTWSPGLPAQAYLYKEDAEGTHGPDGWTAGFPHPLRGLPSSTKPDLAFYRQWEASPFSDAYLGRLAEAAVDSLGLGKSVGTDYLGISFSALDLVGHGYGPNSHEVQDILVGLDKTLASLFAHLDRTVGSGKYVVALTGDHGAVPVPEQLARIGFDAGRIDGAAIAARIEQALAGPLGAGKHVLRVGDGDVDLAAGVYASLQREPGAMQSVLDAIRSAPGVSQVFRSDELAGRPITGDPIMRAAALSYFPGRSGDLIIIPKPYWFFGYVTRDGSPAIGTTHGVPYLYDQRVPLLLFGAGIKPGEFLSNASPADIAPTLAALCGITLARADGHVLSEALVASSPRVAAPAPRR